MPALQKPKYLKYNIKYNIPIKQCYSHFVNYSFAFRNLAIKPKNDITKDPWN